MAYIIDPNAPLPVPPVIGTSDDGKLRAILDAEHSGVQLWYRSGLPAQPRRNLSKIPSLGWAGMSAGGSATLTVDASWALFGPTSLKVTSTGHSSAAAYPARTTGTDGDPQQIYLEPSHTYTVSCYCRYTAAISGTGPKISATNYDASGVGDSNFAIGEAVDPTKPGVYRLSVTFTVPADSTGLTIRLFAGIPTADDAVWWDGLLIEEGTTLGDYFDGDTPNSDDFEYQWDGSDGGSISIATPRRISKVLFSRTDDSPVRSGNYARAVGGEAHCYEHEAPLGGPTSWTATPIYDDGTEGTPTEPATLYIPDPKGLRDVWLKPVSDPSAAVRAVVVGDIPELSYEAREDVSDIYGSAFPSVSWDNWAAAKADGMTFLVETAKDRAALQKCLTSGIVLMQTSSAFDWPDMYVKFSTVTRTRLGSIRNVDQTLAASFVEVERPATEDAPVIIPDRSWGDLRRLFADWTAVHDAYTEWGALVAIPTT